MCTCTSRSTRLRNRRASIPRLHCLNKVRQQAEERLPLRKFLAHRSYRPISRWKFRSPGTDMQTVAVLSGVGFFIVLLLAGGLGFTVHEFKRLSAKSSGPSMTVKTIRKGRTEDATATFQHVF